MKDRSFAGPASKWLHQVSKYNKWGRKGQRKLRLIPIRRYCTLFLHQPFLSFLKGNVLG